MKVIDLLNKIANGEKVPKNIEIGNRSYELIDKNDNDFDYQDKDGEYFMEHLIGYYYVTEYLNKEVKTMVYKEIEDKEIEYIKGDYTLPVRPAKENEAFISGCLFAHEDKINELIKVVNELKKGK